MQSRSFKSLDIFYYQMVVISEIQHSPTLNVCSGKEVQN